MRFLWDQDCRRSFEKLKSLLSSSSVIANFNISRHTRLYVDHGPEGVAAKVAQRYLDEDSGVVIYCSVHHNSSFLTDTEEKYSNVVESLAVLMEIKSN